MRSLAEVDRDLDELGVATARLAEMRARATAVRPASLEAADEELAALAAGTTPVTRAAPRVEVPPKAEPPRVEAKAEPVVEVVEAKAEPTLEVSVDDEAASEGPPSGLIEVSDEVLRSAELPAVLALDAEPAPAVEAPNEDIAGALSALALDLDSGETPIELAPEPRRASPSTLPPAADDAALAESSLPGLDDPDADLASLLGDADPLRDIEPSTATADDGFGDLEDEHTAMFTAADAARFSRPPAPDGTSGEDFELDIEEVELDEDLLEPVSAAAPVPGRTQPPPPPRTQPPEPPKRPSAAPPSGFLGKLLQRKP